MDVLADVLKKIRLKSHSYFCSEFASPWGLDISQSREGMFHIVIDGRCWLRIDGVENPVQLDEGDIVAFPHGTAHAVSDSLDSPRLPGGKVVEEVLSGYNPFGHSHADEQSNTLLCGSFAFDTSFTHPFIDDLPQLIHLKMNGNEDLNWLKTLVSVLSKEMRVQTPGHSVLVDRLTEVLFIQVIRTYMSETPDGAGYFCALADPKISMALSIIHEDEKALLNVNRLGSRVGMSRTNFHKKFSALVGESPKAYILHWRLQQARFKLTESQAPIAMIAEFAGYTSEAAFGKAFKKYFSISPGAVRKKAISQLFDNVVND